MTTTIESPLAGVVIAIETAEGTAVEAGATLVVVESMKMEIPVETDTAGVVRKLHLAVGDSVTEGQAVADIG